MKKAKKTPSTTTPGGTFSKTKGELPVIPVDERAAEVRAIKAS